jgi:hypothetical protein
MLRTILLVALGAAIVPSLLGIRCNPPPNNGPAPITYAITPTEAKSGEKIWIRGRGMDNENYHPRIVDPLRINDSYPPLIVNQREPNWIELMVPSGLSSRKLFEIWLTPDSNPFQPGPETVIGKSRSVYLRASESAPTGQQIRYAFVNAGWKFACDASGNNCEWPALHGWKPEESPYSTAWSSPPWDKHRLLIDQSSRDWQTMCSKAWRAPTTHTKRLRDGFTEAYTREEFFYNPWWWLETSSDSPYTSRNHYWTGSGPLRSMATGNVPFPLSDGRHLGICDPEFFTCNFAGTRSDAAVVFFVGAFFYYGSEVDPNNPISGFRAFTGTSWWPLINDAALGEACCTNTHGLIVISGSPSRGYFPRPATYTSGGGSIWPLLSALDACNRESCWPGPGYSTDHTPNLLSHELTHLLTDRADPGDSAAIEDSPFIKNDKDDGGTYRRGFDLNVSAIGATPQSECSAARSGCCGFDPTH